MIETFTKKQIIEILGPKLSKEFGVDEDTICSLLKKFLIKKIKKIPKNTYFYKTGLYQKEYDLVCNKLFSNEKGPQSEVGILISVISKIYHDVYNNEISARFSYDNCIPTDYKDSPLVKQYFVENKISKTKREYNIMIDKLVLMLKTKIPALFWDISGYNLQTDSIYFWGKESPLSQWSPHKFKDENGIEYKTAEHYMMYQKAILFQDVKTADEILNSNSAATVKKLGRKVKNFDQKVWDEHKFEIVVKGNSFKFSQNKGILENTGNSTLVEASPYDKIWGVGLKADNPKIHNPDNWKGQNLLGKALMKVRQIPINYYNYQKNGAFINQLMYTGFSYELHRCLVYDIEMQNKESVIIKYGLDREIYNFTEEDREIYGNYDDIREYILFGMYTIN